jgi:hypothetical protein
VSERLQFPPAPLKSRVAGADGLYTLQWLAWFGALTNWVQRTRIYVFPHDVPNIPALGGYFVSFSCPGAVVGDFATASMDPAAQDLAVSAQITAADTATVWIRNWGGAGIDPAAGTIRIRVERAR